MIVSQNSAMSLSIHALTSTASLEVKAWVNNYSLYKTTVVIDYICPISILTLLVKWIPVAPFTNMV